MLFSKYLALKGFWSHLLHLCFYTLAIGLAVWILCAQASHHNHHHHHHHGQHGHPEHEDKNGEYHYLPHDLPRPGTGPKVHHAHLHHTFSAAELFLQFFKDETTALNTCAFILATLPVSFTLLFPSALPKFFEAVLVSFSAGSLFGDLFLHAFPTMQHTAWTHCLAGFLLFYALQRLLFLATGHACHAHTHAEPAPRTRQTDTARQTAATHATPTVWLQLFATLTHTFTNGLLLALAFHQGGALQGLSGALALLLHELPHRFSDFTLLMAAGASRAFARRAQILVAMSTLTGSQLAHYVPEKYFTLALPMATGGLMYIATTTILPVLIHSNVTGFKGLVYLLFEAASMAGGLWIMQQFA